MAGMEHVISVEELLSRKVNVARKEAGETSRGNDQPIIAAYQKTERSSVEVQLTEKVKQRLEQLEKAGNQAGKSTGPKIQKVTFLLQDYKNVAKYFEPRAVSIGPIHHGQPKYQLAEEYKLRLANKFIKECGSGTDKKAESLYVEIQKKIKQLKEYFDEEVIKKYDDDEDLTLMLFVDGCAVLQFIYYAVEDKFEDVKIKNDRVVFWKQDLFLLENQLPYELLKDLMKLSEKKETLKNSINRFIDKQAAMEAANCNDKKTCIEKPAHLLDRLRTRLLIGNAKSSDNSSQQKNGKSPNQYPMNGTHDQGNKSNDKSSKNKGQQGQVLHSFRNVQELREAGIQLKTSKTSSLRDVSFANHQFSSFYHGHLSLPQITVDDSTGPKFLNLIAYEMCPDFDNDFSVTSYICFLDSLIDHPEDVKELRKEHILHNLLGSDKEVSQLFNDIATDLVPNPKTYADVKGKIQECYDNKWKTWIVEFIHDHFSSPWTIVGFLAAFLAVVLFAIQTWYTVR